MGRSARYLALTLLMLLLATGQDWLALPVTARAAHQDKGVVETGKEVDEEGSGDGEFVMPFEDPSGSEEEVPARAGREAPAAGAEDAGPWVWGLSNPRDAAAVSVSGVRHVINLRELDLAWLHSVVQYHASRRLGLCLTLRWADAEDPQKDRPPSLQEGRVAIEALLAVVGSVEAKRLGSGLWLQFFSDLGAGPGAVAPEDLDGMFDFASRAVRKLREEGFAGRICGPTLDGLVTAEHAEQEVEAGDLGLLPTARSVRWSAQFADAVDVHVRVDSGAEASRVVGKVRLLVRTLTEGKDVPLVSWAWSAGRYPDPSNEEGLERATLDVWQALRRADVGPAAYGPFQAGPEIAPDTEPFTGLDLAGNPVEPIFSTIRQIAMEEAEARKNKPDGATRTDEGESSIPVQPIVKTGKVGPVYAGVTHLGVSGGLNGEMLQDLGVKTARVVLTGKQVRQLLDAPAPEGGLDFVGRLRELKESGVQVILTVRWPAADLVSEASNGSPSDKSRTSAGSSQRRASATSRSTSRGKKAPAQPVYRAVGDFDAALTGRAREDAILLVEDLLTRTAGSLDWIQIQNEAAGISGNYPTEEMIFDPRRDASPAVDWMRALARRIGEMRKENPALANLKIMGPAIRESVILERVNGGRASETTEGKVLTAFIDELIKFSETHTDAMDLHLHVGSVAEAETVVGYVRERSQVQLTSTEWSAEGAGESWLRKVVEDPGTFGNVNNAKFLQDAYAQKVSQRLWDQFVDTAPLPRGFMTEMYSFLSRSGFVHACYGSVYQVGSPRQDWKALYATLTVGGRTCRNGVIWRTFSEIARNQAHARD